MEDGIPKVIANPPETLSPTKWVLPFWRERPLRQACRTSTMSSAGVLVTEDAGASWKPYGACLRGGCTVRVSGEGGGVLVTEDVRCVSPGRVGACW